MKLPRYLQISLAVTLAVVAWSQFSGQETSQPQALAVTPPASRPPTPAPKPPAARTDLFALPPAPVAQTPAAQEEQAEAARQQAPEPETPTLPLAVLGAWWQQHQRIILLTDGRETWPVCHRCRADNAIWTGSSPVSGWVLKAVEQDHLLFEWQSTHASQRLELDDLQSEPTH